MSEPSEELPAELGVTAEALRAALGQGLDTKGNGWYFALGYDHAASLLRKRYGIIDDCKDKEIAKLRKQLEELIHQRGGIDQLESEVAKLQAENEECSARLASVTSAFLVLKHDKTITGGARKLIEKECELLATKASGGHLIRQLRELRAESDDLKRHADHYSAQVAKLRAENERLKEKLAEFEATDKALGELAERRKARRLSPEAAQEQETKQQEGN